MLLDRLMPDYDATRIEHRVISGDLEAVYVAVREADFVETWRESAAVRLLFGARALVERALSFLRGRPAPQAPAPESMRLADMPTSGEWVLLDEDPPHEVSFGAIGRFWAGETAWDEIDAAEFASFDRPGRARIACSFTLRPYGDRATLVSYECRTKGTDAASTKAFLRYWRALSPFIGVVLRTQLGVVAARASDTGSPGSPSL